MRKNDLIRKNMVESVRNERNILAMANNPFVVGLLLLYHIMHEVRGIHCVQLALQCFQHCVTVLWNCAVYSNCLPAVPLTVTSPAAVMSPAAASSC